MALLPPLLQYYRLGNPRQSSITNRFINTGTTFIRVFDSVRSLGVVAEQEEHERRKLVIFNQLCLFQFITATLIPLVGYLHSKNIPSYVWLVASLPALISLLVLYLNYKLKHEAARLSYFILYPLFISAVYLSRIDLGIELTFILCGILSVFFLKDMGYMVFSISFSMISYFALFLVKQKYPFPPFPPDQLAYLLNQAFTIIYIFYALYLIMKENTGYEASLLEKNRNLVEKNEEIEKQQMLISHKAFLLEKQASRLRESNRVKNKLFSIIAHDLKDPMFALRNFFQVAGKKGITAEELDSLMPDIINDLNCSTVLVENLLEWAKSQMKSDNANPQNIEISKIAFETIKLLQLQFRNKQIQVVTKIDFDARAFADKEMITLVLRNLLSNAIKFTPEKGRIIIGINETFSGVQVHVTDSGKGISRQEMKEINKNIFFSTTGTKNEIGTGLGLMLCKEFLAKNESSLIIKSEPGQGSTFSFTLPPVKKDCITAINPAMIENKGAKN